MKTVKQDKMLSGMLLLISCLLIIYGLGSAETMDTFKNWTTGEIFTYLLNHFFDIIFIGYVFICLQVAGYFELRYQKDYLICSILAILFTPISLLFIRHNDEN